MEQEQVGVQLRQRIVTVGNVSLFFGAFFVLGSILCIVILPGLLQILFIPLLVQILVALALLILGWLIKKDPSASSKGKIIVVLILGVVIFIVDLFSLSAVSIASIYLIVDSLLAIGAARILTSPESLAREVQKRQTVKNWSTRQKTFDFIKVIGIAILVLAAFVSLDYGRYVVTKAPTLSSDPVVNATAAEIPGDLKTKKDFVIDHDLINLLVTSGSYETNHHLNYSGYCGTVQPQLDEVAKLNVGGAQNVKCTDGDFGMAVSSSLNSGAYECVDTAGYLNKTESALHSGPLCQPISSSTKPTWYIIIPTGNSLTKAKVHVEYDSFLPIDNVGQVDMIAGELPPGIKISCSSGTRCDGREFLMGAPTKSGTYTFTVAYSNSSYKQTTTFTVVVSN